jgi:hypothetical protein
MENNQKPEWFELADNDQPISRPLKKKSAPMRSLTFVLASALVIPMGAGFALLTHEDHSTIAADVLNLVQDSPAAATSTAKAPVAITPPGSTSNEIILPPSKKAGDDDDEDDD